MVSNIMTLKKDILRLENLLDLINKLYKDKVSISLNKVNNHIFSLDEKSEDFIKYSTVNNNISVFSNMVIGYVYSFVKDENINQEFNKYLDDFEFLNLDVIHILADILSQDEIKSIINYLMFLDFSKEIVKKYCHC